MEDISGNLCSDPTDLGRVPYLKQVHHKTNIYYFIDIAWVLHHYEATKTIQVTTLLQHSRSKSQLKQSKGVSPSHKHNFI